MRKVINCRLSFLQYKYFVVREGFESNALIYCMHCWFVCLFVGLFVCMLH